MHADVLAPPCLLSPFCRATAVPAAVRPLAGGKRAAVESFRNGTLFVFKAGEGGKFYEPTQHKRWAQSDEYFPISYTPVSDASKAAAPSVASTLAVGTICWLASAASTPWHPHPHCRATSQT